jgi:hypothetical protein
MFEEGYMFIFGFKNPMRKIAYPGETLSSRASCFSYLGVKYSNLFWVHRSLQKGLEDVSRVQVVPGASFDNTRVSV